MKAKVLDNDIFLDTITTAQEAKTLNISMPKVDATGKSVTMNNFGFMFAPTDPLVQNFIKEASTSKSGDFEVLEVGCAYGNVALEVVRKGCTGYIASDISIDHLRVLGRELTDKKTEDFAKHIRLLHAQFPEQINLPDESIQYALMNKVLHFLKPSELDAAFAKMSAMTKKGGKWFVMTVMPECKDYKKFAPVYFARKALGIKYPGFCQNAKDYSSNRDITDQLPQTMLFLTKEEVVSLFTNNGFVIEDCMELATPTTKKPFWSNGKDMLAIIARKI